MIATKQEARTSKTTALDRDILFVFGAARSGTTYLNNLLDHWFDYGMGPEGTFVAQFAGRLDRYGDLEDDANLNRLIEDVARCQMLEIARHKYPDGFRFDVTPEMIRAALPARTYPGVVYSVFACVAQAQDRTHVGNKNPAFWQTLPLLESLFPGTARYLCIVRDGRDVALSMMQMDWGHKSSYVCAQTWVQALHAVHAFARQVPSDRLLVIRYEDLLDDPTVTIGKLEAFLGVDLGERRARLLAEAENNPKRKNYGKWRTKMSASDIRQFEAVAGAELADYGYELTLESPRVSFLEAGVHKFVELLRLVRATVAGRFTR